MVGARLIGVWAAVALAALATCAGAGRAAAADSIRGGSFGLELDGTHGYSLLVLAGVPPGEAEGQVVVLIDKPHSRVVYGAPATLTPTSLDADLGVLGRISLRLQPNGVKQTARDCNRQPIEYEGGTWVGEFEIRGEDGFTTASATRIPYSLKPFLRLLCGSVVFSHGNSDGAVLRIGATGPLPRLSLSARTNGPGKAAEVSATIRERRGEVKIERSVGRRFPSSAFSYHPDLSAASLRPGAPFSGSGTYHRDASPANRWTGNLSVDFPGRAGVPATGAGLRSSLRPGELLRGSHSERAALMAPTLLLWPSTKP